MARRTERIIRFSEKTIKAIETPATGRSEFRDELTPSLTIRTTSDGVKSFCWLKRVNGKLKRVTLGRHPEMSVTAARDEAVRLSGNAVSGKPLIAAKKQAGEWTLGELWAWFHKTHLEVHTTVAEEARRNWNRGYAVFANRAVSDLTTVEIQDLHQKIGETRGHSAANRSLKWLSQMYGMGHRLNRVFVPCPDPTPGIKRFAEFERERFLDEDELPRFLAAVATLKRERSRDVMLMLLWTGARKSNVFAMKWEDISIEAGVWRVPSMETKKRRLIDVQLPEPALEILRRRQKDSRSMWVFPGCGETGHVNHAKEAMKQVAERAKLKDIRLHDLRRTLGSWMAIDAPLQVVGKQLGHTSTASTAIYARLANRTVKAAVAAATEKMLGAVKKKK